MVWEALRDLLDGNREQEIDLLVAWPGLGIAAIEVKGGRISRDGDGWHQESGGQRRRISSPVVQAQNGRHALTRYLERHAPAAARSRAAHLVVFPFTCVPVGWEVPDCPRAMVVDKHDLPDAASRARTAIERHGAGHQSLTPAALEALVDALAGELPGQASLLSAAEEHEQRVDQMTRDQARTLDN